LFLNSLVIDYSGFCVNTLLKIVKIESVCYQIGLTSS